MSQLNKASFEAANNDASTGRYKAGQVDGIGSDDHRAMIVDLKDSVLFIEDHLLDEDDMASDSAMQVPSQQSVKAYIDGLVTLSPATGRSQSRFTWMDITGGTANQDWNLFTTEEDLIINVTAQIVGIKNDGGQGYYAEKAATFRKDGSATAVQVGTTTTLIEHKDDGETTSIAMNSTDVRISVNTGDADTYRWTVFATITKTKL